MNIKVLDNRKIVIDTSNLSDTFGTQNENNATTINFSFPESLANANKKIVFITPEGNLWDLIVNNSYTITNAITQYKIVSAYVWLVDVENDIDFRSKIWKITFNDNQIADGLVPSEEEINAFDTMIAELNDGIRQVDNIDINANKSGTVSIVTITNKEGIEKSVEINDGTDYVITEEDYRNIADIVENEISLDVPTKTSDLTNDSGFIDNTVNNLINYTLRTNTGSLIDLEINSTTYVVTLSLKDINGTVISTDTIDLPLESVVVSGRYDNTTKQVILTLENGSEVAFSVADLVAGLQTEITSQNKLASDLVDDSNSGNKFVTTSEKNTWNAKYDKPNGGIPDTDLSSAVQTSLGKADTALQEETYTGTITSVKMNGNTIATSGEADLGTVITEHQDITGKEDKSNKVTSIDENSTNTQYPSAKLVYDELSEVKAENTALQTEVQTLNEKLELTNSQIPTGEAEGSSINLNDSSNMELESVEVEGDTEQVQCDGYNMLPITPSLKGTTGTSAGVTYTYNQDGSISLSGTSTGNVYININNSSDCYTQFTNGQSYVSYLLGCSKRQIALITRLQSTNTNVLTTGYQEETSVATYSNTTGVDCYSFIHIQGSVECNGLILYPMIVKGTDTTKKFEPYAGGQTSPNPDYPQDVHVVTGECEVEFSTDNLINKQTMCQKNTYIDGAGSCSNAYTASYNYYSVVFPCEANTTYIIRKASDIIFRVGTLSSFPKAQAQTVTSYRNLRYATETTITTDSSAKCIVVVYFNNDCSLSETELRNSLQIKYADYESETYPLSLGNIELCKIGNYQDRIFKSAGKWYLYKEIGKIVLNGSNDEDWHIETIGAGRTNFYIQISEAYGDKDQEIFNSIGIYANNLNNNCKCYISASKNLNYTYDNWSSLNDLRTVLAQTNMIVYFRLATPITTEITNTILISQLNSLAETHTYKGVTNIITTGADLPPILKIGYKKDLETIIDNLQQAIVNS